MTDVHGTWDDRFARLGEILARRIDDGDDLGASVALTIEGEPVVDLWAGWTDQARTRPWQEDTLVNVWSTTKTMTNLCALVLADRGELDVYAPVARYWPEFAANGKDGIEVRHLLSHTSGVSGWEQPFAVEDLYDAEAAAARLAGQAPWWEPGTASGYHAISQGHLVGEVIRRVDGRSLGTFFAEEVAGPLGADFHIGLDPSQHHRVSDVIAPPPLELDPSLLAPDSPAVKTFTGPGTPAEAANTAAWRQAEIGAAGGQGNARSVARIQSVVSNGGTVGGVTLLSPATLDLIFDQQSDGIDVVLGAPFRFGIGYGLPNETVAWINGGRPSTKACFWGGWGGSIVINDLERRLTLTYMMNKMAAGILGNPTSAELATALYDIVG